MNLSKKLLNLNFFVLCFTITSCSSIETTLDSISDSVESAGDYLYDSVNFWEDEEEPEQSDAVIIEEAVEVPEFALPDQDYFDQNQDTFDMGQSQNFAQPAPYFNPIYRSQRQYYYVGPNGTPMPAPPPPPFPQYSIDQQQVAPYSYNNNLGYPALPNPYVEQPQQFQNNNPRIIAPEPISKDEEMELFGIQNNCIRVKEDFVNGGYMCDDFD